MIKIILPTHNEEKALLGLLSSFMNMLIEKRMSDFQIFLINDGSKDKTTSYFANRTLRMRW